MFCFQCQETVKNQGCTVRGVCGKPEETAALQDLLVYVCKGIAVYAEKLNAVDKKVGRYVCEALFTTITNAAWDDAGIIAKIEDGLKIRDDVKVKAGSAVSGALPDCATWTPKNKEEMMAKALSGEVRINATSNEDVTSLRSLLIFGVKGICAYAEHAAVLGYEKDDIYQFLMEALAVAVLGGLSGAALGVFLASWAAEVTSWPPIITVRSIAFGLGSSVLVGLLAGMYPAVVASRLDPVVALSRD